MLLSETGGAGGSPMTKEGSHLSPFPSHLLVQGHEFISVL